MRSTQESLLPEFGGYAKAYFENWEIEVRKVLFKLLASWVAALGLFIVTINFGLRAEGSEAEGGGWYFGVLAIISLLLFCLVLGGLSELGADYRRKRTSCRSVRENFSHSRFALVCKESYGTHFPSVDKSFDDWARAEEYTAPYLIDYFEKMDRLRRRWNVGNR